MSECVTSRCYTINVLYFVIGVCLSGMCIWSVCGVCGVCMCVYVCVFVCVFEMLCNKCALSGICTGDRTQKA